MLACQRVPNGVVSSAKSTIISPSLKPLAAGYNGYRAPRRGLPRPTMALEKSNAFPLWASNVASGFPSLYAQNQASQTSEILTGRGVDHGAFEPPQHTVGL